MRGMLDIDDRARQADTLWRQGDAALAKGDAKAAYRLYTEAHDLVTDCARLHEQAHIRLKAVTRLHADKREFITDSILLALAPLGIFHLIALAFRTKACASALCRGRAA